MYIFSDEYNERVENMQYDLETYYIALMSFKVAVRCLRQIISGCGEVVKDDK